MDSQSQDLSSFDNSELLGPALPVTSRSGTRSSSSSIPHKQQSKVKTRETSEWVETSSLTFTNSDRALLSNSIEHVELLLDAIYSAVRGHEDATSVPLDIHKRFKGWKDGIEGLDQKLDRAPRVRAPFIETLATLVLHLSQGIEYCDSQRQSTLRQTTSQIIDQAATLVRIVPVELHSSTDVVGFLSAKYQDFESRVDKLFEQLPMLDNLFENLDDTEPAQTQEGRLGEDRAGAIVLASPKSCQSLNADIHASHNATISYNAADHKSLSESTRSSAEKSSSNSQYSGFPFFQSDDEAHDSMNPLSDTNTSDLVSQAPSSKSQSIPFSPPRAPSHHSVLMSIKDRLTNDRAHSSDAHASVRSRPPTANTSVKDCSTSGSRSSGLTPMNGIEWIDIRRDDDTESRECRVMLDSGSSGDFIVRRVVEECGLDIHPLSDEEKEHYEMMNGDEIEVQEFVQPVWKFSRKGHTWRPSTRFLVLNYLPNMLDMVLGGKSLTSMGIGLYAVNAALVAFRKGGKDETGQGHSQRTRQSVDGSASQSQRQKILDKKHEDGKRPARDRKSQYPESQKEASKPDYGQHTK